MHRKNASYTRGVILLLIRRMAASFGRLQNHTLELKEGLNIIQAPNETGKSTWCAFMAAMFYGINSRERDKAGFIADKNRYAPWSGTAMSGRIDCKADDTELTLMRATRRQNAPMGEFKAVYSGTGDTVPELNGQNCGEMLLGVSREVFERSAFIRQSGLSITQDAGLERRIAALITSGEEDTSYSETYDALKKQLNRRRHNKTGQLPVLEQQLSDAQRQLSELHTLEQQLTQTQERTRQLLEIEGKLADELAQHQRWEAHSRRQALVEAEADLVHAEQRCSELRQAISREQIPENDTIARLRGAIVNLETVRKSVDKARAERDEAMKALLKAESAVNESPFAGQTPEQARKAVAAVPKIRPRLWWLPVLVFPATLSITYLATQGSFPLSALASSVAILVTFLILALRESGDRKKHSAYLAAFSANDTDELAAQLNSYLNVYEAYEAAQEELDKRSAAADTLYSSLSSNEQGILLEVRRFAPAAFDIPTADQLLRSCGIRRKSLTEAETTLRDARLRRDILRQQLPAEAENDVGMPSQPPLRSRDVVASQLGQVRTALAANRSAADRLSGQLGATGDSVVLTSEIAHLSAEKDTLEGEYAAIRMAMDALESANTTLQNRFSPALGRRAAEIFSQLTGGNYSGVVLDRSFHLSAEPAGDSIYRDAQLLSAGASDQLYLAVRLAICDLVLPEDKAVPIILDDALTNFDDTRCAAALRWLKEEAKYRQILLFTCHSREAEFFAGDSEVSIQRLTNAV